MYGYHARMQLWNAVPKNTAHVTENKRMRRMNAVLLDWQPKRTAHVCVASAFIIEGHSRFYPRIWPLTSIIAQAPSRNRCIQCDAPSVNMVTNKIYLSVCLVNSGICSTS